MDLRLTRTFVTVAELGTVSEAALLLRIAQPALSRQLRELEQQLGLKLFDRVGRRLRLTDQGTQLLDDCRGLLNHAGAIDERAQSLRRGDSGLLRVAASPQFIESVVSDVLHRYAERFPDVEVRLTEAVGLENLAMVERGEIHLGQNLLNTVEPNDKRFASHTLGAVELLAVCRERLPGAGAHAVEIERLAAFPLLLLDAGFSVRRTFDAACRLAGIKPKVRFESRSPHTLLSLAAGGHGIAIIPSTLRTHRRDVHIARLTYRGRPVSESLTLVWDRRRPLPPYAAAFCELCAAHIRAVFPITGPAQPVGAAPVSRRANAKPRARRARSAS